MDLPSKAVIDVLTFLLPGFITAALLYRLTPAPRPIPFERVIEALIFTFIVQAFVAGLEWGLLTIGSRWGAVGSWTDQVKIGWSLIMAVLLALLLAWTENTDRVHALLRKAHITHQTSFPSEWFGALSQHVGYLVLHLKGERRLYGWAEEWPNQPDRGHFVMAEAEWLDEDGKGTPLTGVRQVLVPATDVELVELMEAVTRTSTATEGEPDGRSQATDAGTESPGSQRREPE